MGTCCASQIKKIQYQGEKVDVKLNGPQTEASDEIARLDQIKMEVVQKKISEDQRKQEENLLQEEKQLITETAHKEEFLDFHQFIHLYQKMIHFYKQHDLYVANDLAKEITDLEDKIKQTRSLSEESFLQKLKLIEESWQVNTLGHKIESYDSTYILKIEKEMKDVLFYQHEVQKAPFTQKYNDGKTKISTRKDQNSIGTLIETELNIPFQTFVAILTEVEYFPDMIPFCEQSVVISELARNSRIGHVILNFPFVTRREAYFQGSSYFRFKHKRDIILYTRSIHDKPELQKEFDIAATLNQDYVPLNYKYFVLTYEPLSEESGKLKFAYNFEHGLNFLPEFIEDFNNREYGKRLFSNIIDISKDFRGSKWEKKMAQNPELCLLMRQKIKQQLQFSRSQKKI